MDLSWCIICDNRLDNDSNLYCSDACKMKDCNATTGTPKGRASSPVAKNTKTSKRTAAAPSSSYPWIPLYRRRRPGFFIVPKRSPQACKPTGSLTSQEHSINNNVVV